MKELAVPDINNPRIMWYPYVLEYKTCDGTFQTEIYATGDDHAEMICSELIESARVVGKKIGEVSW